MLTRFASTPGVGSLLAVAALASLSMLASGADGRVRLDASVLDQSRGRDLGGGVAEKDCNALNNVPPCVNTGEPCTTCATSKYRALDGDILGGAVPGAGAANCGSVQEGICNWHLECVNTTDTVRGCIAPPPPLDQADTGIGAGD